MFILKIQYNADLHRINLPDISSLKGINDIRSRAISCFPELCTFILRICYVDDEGDSIRIKQDSELQEALQYCLDVGNKGMKFIITVEGEQNQQQTPKTNTSDINSFASLNTFRSSLGTTAANAILDHEYIINAHRSLPTVLPILPGVIPMMSSFFVNLSQIAAKLSPDRSPDISVDAGNQAKNEKPPDAEVQQELSELKRSIEHFQNQIRHLTDSGGPLYYTFSSKSENPKRIQKRNSGPLLKPELSLSEHSELPVLGLKSRRASLPSTTITIDNDNTTDVPSHHHNHNDDDDPQTPMSPIDMPRFHSSGSSLKKSFSEDLFAGSKMGVLMQQMKDAGFDNDTQNILALSTSGGNLMEAITVLRNRHDTF